MLLLTIRTDKPEAEIGLFQDANELAYQRWLAHRQLAETIHRKVTDMLNGQGRDLHDLEGIICFKGPGSFTGLRIGMTVANALANSLDIPIVSSGTENWIEDCIQRLLRNENEIVSLPDYGSAVYTTLPKK